MQDIRRIDLVDIELTGGTLHRSWLKHSIGKDDEKANCFGVRVFRNGEPVNLGGGSVQGHFLDPHGNHIAITTGNHVDSAGNVAYVVLPASCYNYEGQFSLAIKLLNTDDDITGTMRIVDGMVDNTYTDNPVAPVDSLPDYEDIIAVYEEMVEAKEGAVRFDIEQDLEAGDMLQARANIEAASAEQVDELAVAAVRHDIDQSQIISEAGKARARENIEAASAEQLDDLETAAVRHDINQSQIISADGKAMARGNIEAASAEDVEKIKAGNDAARMDYSSVSWEVGGISADNGDNVLGTNRLRYAGFIPKGKIYAIESDRDYSFLLYAYQADGTFIGTWNGTTFAPSSYEYVKRVDTFGAQCDKFRITIRKDTDTTGDISFADHIRIMFYERSVLEETQGLLRSVTGEISDGQDYISIEKIDGIDTFRTGAINSSGQDTDGADYYKNSFRCMMMETGDAEVIVSQVALVSTPSQAWYHYVYFYDSNKEFISRTGGQTYGNVTADVPASAAYFRISLTQVRDTDVTTTNIATYTLKRALKYSGGKGSTVNKWYVLGDSISAGYYSMTEEEAEAEGVELVYYPEGISGVGAAWDTTLRHNYWGYANRWVLGRTLAGRAYPGQGYLRKAANSQNGIYVVENTNFADAGLITVAWGFNDWHYNLTRGDHTLIDSSVPYPTAGYDTTQLTTINHAIWYCLGELIRKAPQAKIVVQTPINGWLYGGDFNTNWGIGYTMSNSGKLSDIHDDIKYWADYYGLQVLEMTYNNSIVNRLNIQNALIDGSHPTDETHQQLGRHVAHMIGYC